MKKSKMSKRIMAVTLSVAMMMSNMTVTATEIETEQQTKAVTVEKSAQTTVIEEEDAASESEESSAAESPTEDISEEETKAVTLLNLDLAESVYGKTDVWDLGAEELDTSKYTNKLTADIINSWYPDVEAGTKGRNLAGFEVLDADGNVAFCFADGGYSSTHRLRTTNAALTHYDDKSINYDGTTYTGYIYSNKSATKDVYVGICLEEGDILTAIVSSNSGASTIGFESPKGKVETQEYDRSTAATAMTFYAGQTGLYKIYSTNEKLVFARAYVEHTQTVDVTGTVNAPEDLTRYMNTRPMKW